MIVNRRGFLGMMIGGVVAGAAVRTWPFRVFSFPSEIKTFDLVTDIYKARGDTVIKTFMQNGRGSTVIAKNAIELSRWQDFGYEVVQHKPKEILIADKIMESFTNRRYKLLGTAIEPNVGKLQISLPGEVLDNDMILKPI
jgi:Rieske Fe-S protein